jgi:hypothetical protein
VNHQWTHVLLITISSVQRRRGRDVVSLTRVKLKLMIKAACVDLTAGVEGGNLLKGGCCLRKLVVEKEGS